MQAWEEFRVRVRVKVGVTVRVRFRVKVRVRFRVRVRVASLRRGGSTDGECAGCASPPNYGAQS